MILEAPGRWAMRNGTRRVLLGRFPYAIVYREVDDEVEIVAIAHFRRRPTSPSVEPCLGKLPVW